MKTKLLAVMMMALAAVGIIGGIAEAQVKWDDTAGFWKATGVEGVGVSWAKDSKNGASSTSLLDTITKAVNWVLGMLAFVALCICLWGGFQMVTAAGDDGKYKKGMTILKQAAIGLVIIGVSWMFVSVIFWIIWNAASPSAWTNTAAKSASSQTNS